VIDVQAIEVRFVPQNAMILTAGAAVSGCYMILSGEPSHCHSSLTHMELVEW
jgi:hypothetical protein